MAGVHQDGAPVDGPAGGLVDRRAGLLGVVRRDPSRRPELERLTDELRTVLAGAEPTVRLVPATDTDGLAARLMAREPVHPLDDGVDPVATVADRTDRDRRLVVLEHPRLPGRPINVVWVALEHGVPSRIADILDLAAPAGDPRDADSAVFWSVWNAEPGLAGLGRGRTLIEGAIALLQAQLPWLSTYVTLSPIPTFRSSLQERGLGRPADDEIERACATYLTSLGADGRPLDPVARFHLGNGASLWRISRDGDPTTRGMNRSYGVMVNYRYEPEDREANRRSLGQGVVATSASVDALLG